MYPAAPLNSPVFFSEKAFAAIEGKEPLDQLMTLDAMVREAEADKAAGSGPPRDEIDIVRRRFVRIYKENYR